MTALLRQETETKVVLEEVSNIVGEPTGETREATISKTPHGLRINLPLKGKSPEESPDVYLEATPNGWRVLVHANSDEEPFSIAEVLDSGKHEAYFQEENVPQ